MRSPVAAANGDARVCWDTEAAAAIVSTGRATWGLGAGSSSLMLFSKCWNDKSNSFVPYRLRGSGNPARTWVCAT
eukprot:scaffold105805_cov51-Attheya_sp.AAC.1